MARARTVIVRSRSIDLHVFTGTVVGEKRWSTTQVYGGGGGGHVQNGSGYVSPTSITSTTTTHDEVFVRAADGEERAFQLSDVSLQVRQGHRVSFVWGIQEGGTNGPIVVVYNHDLKATSSVDDGIKRILGPLIGRRWWLGLAAVVGLSFLMPDGLGNSVRFLSVLFLPILAVVRAVARRRALRAFLGELETLLAQLKSAPMASLTAGGLAQQIEPGGRPEPT